MTTVFVITNADTLSCLPLSTIPTDTQTTGDTELLFECLQVSSNICCRTDRDSLLAKVQTFVVQWWPIHLEEEEF